MKTHLFRTQLRGTRARARTRARKRLNRFSSIAFLESWNPGIWFVCQRHPNKSLRVRVPFH
jgi:hypothetical protein